VFFTNVAFSRKCVLNISVGNKPLIEQGKVWLFLDNINPGTEGQKELSSKPTLATDDQNRVLFFLGEDEREFRLKTVNNILVELELAVELGEKVG
jgi:hypothetical protein